MTSEELATVRRDMDAILAAAAAEGQLDEQFGQLLSLQDESNPDFVSEVATLYFTDSAEKLDRLQARLADTSAAPPPWSEVDAAVHQFKGASASFGAAAVVAGCVRTREACSAGDGAAVAALLAATRGAFEALRARMEAYLALDARRKALERGATATA